MEELPWNCDFTLLSYALLTVILAVHLVPYLNDPHRIRVNGISGPFLAMFSDIYLGWVAVQGRRSEIVDDLHKKYGEYGVRETSNSTNQRSSNIYVTFRHLRPARAKPRIHK